VNQGGSITLTGSFTDPGTNEADTVAIDWGDGSSSTLNLLAGAAQFSAGHQFLDNNADSAPASLAPIQVTVTDGHGGSASAERDLMVINVPPTNLVLGLPQAVSEGTTTTLTGSFSDPGTQDTHAVTVNWGDGNVSNLNLNAGQTSFTATHPYFLDNSTGSATQVDNVLVIVSDNHSGFDFGTTSVQANNVPPSNLSLNSPTAQENGMAMLIGSFADPGTNEPHVVTIDWGDGSAQQTLDLSATITSFSQAHQYLAPGNFSVHVTVADNHLGSTSGSTSVAVSNVPPSNLVLEAPLTANEGDTTTLTGFFADPGTLDTHTVVVQWGDGTSSTLSLAAGVTTFQTNHQYVDADTSGLSSASFTIQGTVTDSPGGSTTGSTSITVNFASEPDISGNGVAISGHEYSALSNVQVAQFTHAFGSPDAGIFSATIHWGDNTTSAGTISKQNGSYTVTGSHTYSARGTFNVEVDVSEEGAVKSLTSTATISMELMPDGSVGTPNQQYVAQVYRTLLQRGVDMAGLNYWTGLLAQGKPKSTIADFFTHSAEYYQINVIEPAYQKFLNRAADQTGLDFWTTRLQGGMTDEQMQAGFIASAEFYANANHSSTPVTPTPAADRLWVDALYVVLLNRLPDANGETFWTNQLQGVETRIEVANGFTGSTEGLSLRIQQTYQRYLGRPADTDGLGFWLSQYHSGATNEDIVTGFIGSDEFFIQATT
jgi:hypothetical protein